MTVPHPPLTIFKTALIVTDNEGHAKIDRDFLKRARIPASRHTTSGIEALALLRRGGFDLVICDATLADMDGRDFVAALRADAALAGLPVILTMLDGRRDEVLAAVQLGVAGICLRPYSQDTFDKHLLMAGHMARFAASEKAALLRAAHREAAGETDQAAQDFAAVAETPDAAPKYFEQGMLALAGRDYERAIMAFHKALSINEFFVEAYLGLARVWQAKGSARRFRQFMKQAASACARTKRFLELRDQFIDALKNDEAGFNPFLALGNELLRDRHYTAAVALFRHALELAPKNADAYLGLSKAYHFLRRPDLAERAIGKSVALNGRNEEARTIQKRLSGQHGDGAPPLLTPQAETPDPSCYPLLLRGVLYLAGMAADALVRSKRHARAA
ncbi:response regulator receiver protein [Solidesulfovibrio fructosivorans JJ]]|uniref:Response regulator receiver protein n=1 Tax=Solidesulfovibrio fructosivorans JJ] TaxID=596151 RepID=E1K1W5_SOLFR|nr:response regulator [Solidesulfovibrio fructosivorans]EFL49371.1 response regulator receiver protein [Solidesulfovibrio fructosivorans JJ]]